jgi:hypothetical protein
MDLSAADVWVRIPLNRKNIFLCPSVGHCRIRSEKSKKIVDFREL